MLARTMALSIALLLLSTACSSDRKNSDETKPVVTDGTKPVEPSPGVLPPAPGVGDEKPAQPSILGTWAICEKTSDFYQSRSILSTGYSYTFKDNGRFEESFIIFKDDDCKHALTSEQAVAAGLTAGFPDSFNESYEGTYVLGAPDANRIGAIDFIYDSEEDGSLFGAYKIEGEKLFVSKFCPADESPVIGCQAGDSPANRAMSFEGVSPLLRK